jgi:hypothetical protein
MPKLNITHLPERLQERLDKLERGDEIDARDVKALLTVEQVKRLDVALAEQKLLRANYRQPKTDEKRLAIGWKTIREVRIEIYKQAIAELQDGLVEGMEGLKKEREVKAARVFMDAFSKAKKEGKNAWSAGGIALTRNGFRNDGGSGLTKRDTEVWDLEEQLRIQLKTRQKKG